MWHHRLLLCWMTLIEGVSVSCQLAGDLQRNGDEDATTSTASPDMTLNLVSPSTESPTNYVSVFPHNNILTVAPTPILEAVVPAESEPTSLFTVEPSPTSSALLTSIGAYSEERQRTIHPDPNTQYSSLFRGDIPLQLDSEENTDDSIDPLFSRPTEGPVSSYIPLIFPDTTDVFDVPLNNDDSLEFKDISVNNSAKSSGISIRDDTSDISTSLEVHSIDFTNTQSNSESPTTSVYNHNADNDFFGAVAEAGQLAPTTQRIDLITVYTSSPLQLHDKWTWFYMILRGNCHFVDLKKSHVLFSDFIKSFSALLLYNREHIIIDSMTCSGRRMTVNMSIDSMYYPNCEKDLRTLLAHRNLRINLHNASFYIHSYETQRTLIFETKQDLEKERNSDILYMTLGGVGISLICILFAGVLFTIYQCCAVKKTKRQPMDASGKYLTESPRSLRPKFEIDQSMSFSDQVTYSVNMYKSYSDLTAPDLYSHLGSPNPPEPRKENISKNTTILTKIPKDKKKKKKKKRNEYGIYGLNDCEAYQEFWSESITQANEDFITVRNLNGMTSSFKTNVKETDTDSLYPLLKQGLPKPVPEKYSMIHEDLPPPPPPPPPLPTTCPSSPAISRGVLERMDQLIFNNFSNSSPDINTCSAYATTYSNTTINIPGASSTIFTNSPSNTSNINTNSTPETLSKTTTSADRRSPPTTSASAENLCLTRITFMEMCVWPQHSSPQLNLDGPQSKGQSQLK